MAEHQARNVRHFDDEADTYEQAKPYLKDWATQVVRSYVELSQGHVTLTPDTSVLECGCGTGLLSELLAPNVKQVVGVDISPKMVEVYNRKVEQRQIPNMKALCLDVCDSDAVEMARRDGRLPAQGFDICCLHMTLHHVSDDSSLIKALATLLLPGGHLLLSDIDKTPLSKLFHPPNAEHTVSHPGGYSEDEVKSLMEAVGIQFLSFHPRAAVALRDVPQPDGASAKTEFPLFLAIGQRHS